jgi:hypothetical protein
MSDGADYEKKEREMGETIRTDREDSGTADLSTSFELERECHMK